MTGQPLCYGVRRLNPFQGILQVVELGDAEALGRKPELWAASARSDHSFQSSALLERGIPARQGHDPRHHATLLERLVRDTARRPARFGWFERDADDGGLVVKSAGAKGEGATHRLSTESFPSLLLREAWSQPEDCDLVRDYLNWRAPYLLMLPGMDDRMRDRLEHTARPRALEVDAFYRLYPKVLNTGLLKSIRVEARLRQSRVA